MKVAKERIKVINKEEGKLQTNKKESYKQRSKKVTNKIMEVANERIKVANERKRAMSCALNSDLSFCL
jgi:hypothetical protein